MPLTRESWLDCEQRDDAERCRPNRLLCRKHLIAALKDGAELEHYLMCMYLYAALSLKRYPDQNCTPAQIEIVRRWGNLIFMVSRQEMEHLALVNGILTAIGAPSYFVHSEDFHNRTLLPFRLPVNFSPAANTPSRRPKQFAFSLDRFRQSTIDTFTCLESPSWDQVRHKPLEPCWCFVPAEEHLLMASSSKPAFRHFAPEKPLLAASAPLTAPDQAGAGTVVELYSGIEHAIDTIPEDILFTGTRAQVAVIAQYDIFVTPVTGRRSAKDAINLILHQGEGNLTDPEVSSHFATFFNIRAQLKRIREADPDFEPALALMDNPRPENISNDFTRRMLELSSYSYGTLLLVLTAVYDSFVPTGSAQDVYPHFSEALYESVFAPMMTMVIRKEAEILTMLPTGDADGELAGPSFDIPADVKDILERAQTGNAPELSNIDTFVARFQYLTVNAEELKNHLQHVPADRRERVHEELTFLHQNAYRMADNLKLVYQQGKFSNF